MSTEVFVEEAESIDRVLSPIKSERIIEPKGDPTALSIQIGCILRIREQALVTDRVKDTDEEIFKGIFTDISGVFGDDVGKILAIYEDIKRSSPWQESINEELSSLVIASIMAFPFIRRENVRYSNSDGKFPKGGWEKFALKLGVDSTWLKKFGKGFVSMSDEGKAMVITYLASDMPSPSECMGDYNEWAFAILMASRVR